MSDDSAPADDRAPTGISRRRLLTTGAVAGVLGAGVGVGGAALLWSHPRGSGCLVPARPHRRAAGRRAASAIRRNAGTEVVVSWHTTDAIRNPRVMLGTPTSGFGSTVAAETRTYRDAKSNTEVRVNHARLTGLTPDTDYVYAAVHDGTTPELGTVRTAPAGRKPLRFTSFGDQSTPRLDKLTDGQYLNDNIGSPAAGDTTMAIERMAPLFNLVNGDLCYANLASDRIRTWSDWFANNSRSARYRPWMPAAGNHENEKGNGANRLRRLSDLFCGARIGFEPGVPRAVVLVHRRIGAGDQPAKRRHRIPGWRQLLCARLLRRRAKALAGRRTRRRPA